ncbi:hypothetical protein QRX60_17735 [Amycolatopsis mongoliensis]|uniref:Uncharacterized protein n=1 Tax=Amycolatopsis mongoliensis TaxID=715475 RepID=A0A9Y2NN72_9PSEU|nr:hypothetical protein [Amycolatopsis sp. 4-36]WIY05598.1 hypothetical protein QRX60_17735 [Amycolatopsis sp. 4-36]
MSSNWPPVLMVALTAALTWRRTRPAVARVLRCAAATCLAWWSLRMLAAPSAPVVVLRWRVSGRALTVVLGPPLGQGTE